MSNGPSDNEEDMSTMLRNLAATAFLALFSWHLITLHNIAKSVEVLIEKVSAGNTQELSVSKTKYSLRSI
jgi:Tfp pilus assembly protein PilN